MRFSLQQNQEQQRGRLQDAAADYNRQGVSAILRGADHEAIYYLLSAAVCEPDYWLAFYNLGNCWAKLSENQAALWAYEQAVRNCHHHAPLFLNLGIVCCREGQAKRALPYLEQALRLNPADAKCSAALGFAYYGLGEWGLAWHWYNKAFRLEPHNADFKVSMRIMEKKISDG
ncbi:MAG: tetratricopeptide repeat protein [Dethiobacter sp.]|nr:tetratricopeptide repeat protein [Dethiobacter sp.]